MALFSKGLSRLATLSLAVAGFLLVSPEAFALGPDLCLWSRLFHIPFCPACGSTRALAAFFHGRFFEALSFNRNVVITGPALLILLAHDLLAWRRAPSQRRARGLRSILGLNRVRISE